MNIEKFLLSQLALQVFEFPKINQTIAEPDEIEKEKETRDARKERKNKKKNGMKPINYTT